jgi:hypothetical protein
MRDSARAFESFTNVPPQPDVLRHFGGTKRRRLENR